MQTGFSHLSRAKRVVERRARKLAKTVRGRLPGRLRPTILTYHRIAEETFDPWGTAVSPQHFAGQLSWLCRKRTILPLRQFAELHRRHALPADAIAVTIDDGYACSAEVAVPILHRLGVPATIFLPVALIERRRPFWWDELEQIVLAHQETAISLDGRSFELGKKDPADDRWKFGSPPRTPRQVAFDTICRLLSTKKPSEVESLMNELREQAAQPTHNLSHKAPMSPEQVARTANSLIDFGSHALNHPWLPSLDLGEKEQEIYGSIEPCERMTGSRPAAFAYPFGGFDDDSERLVERAGFECACSTEELPVTETSRVFALPRLQVGDWSAAGLKRALAAL